MVLVTLLHSFPSNTKVNSMMAHYSTEVLFPDNSMMAHSSTEVLFTGNFSEVVDRLFNPFQQPTWIQQVLIWLITLLTITCNLAVFVAVPRVDSLQNSTGAAMISLAIADTGLGILTLLNLIISHILADFYRNTSDPICQVIAFTVPIFCFVSVQTLTFINLNRYLTIAFPLRYPVYVTLKKIVIILFCIWLFSVCFFSPVWGGLVDIKFYENIFLCLPNHASARIYSIIIAFTFLVIPTFVNVYSFVGIFRIARQQNKQVIGGDTNMDQLQSGCRGLSKSNTQIVKILFTMTVGFYIMWLPYISVCLIWETISGHTLHPKVDFISLGFALGNSVVNPLIYLPTIKQYRHTLASMLGLVNYFNSQEHSVFHKRSPNTRLKTQHQSDINDTHITTFD